MRWMEKISQGGFYLDQLHLLRLLHSTHIARHTLLFTQDNPVRDQNVPFSWSGSRYILGTAPHPYIGQIFWKQWISNCLYTNGNIRFDTLFHGDPWAKAPKSAKSMDPRLFELVISCELGRYELSCRSGSLKGWALHRTWTHRPMALQWIRESTCAVKDMTGRLILQMYLCKMSHCPQNRLVLLLNKISSHRLF